LPLTVRHKTAIAKPQTQHTLQIMPRLIRQAKSVTLTAIGSQRNSTKFGHLREGLKLGTQVDLAFRAGVDLDLND
jgi:hypothetical protein